MKRLISLTLALACVAAMAATASAQTKMVRLTRFEGRPITGVNIASTFDVQVIRSEETSAVVEIPAELEELLVFKMENNGTVSIYIENNNRRNINLGKSVLRATIHTPVLNIISAHGAAHLNFQGHFDIAYANIEVQGASSLNNLDLSADGNINMECGGASQISGLNLSAGEYRLSCGGSSSVDGAVSAVKTDCRVSGASNLNLQYIGQEAAMAASGASRINVKVNAAKLDARASGASKAIVYHQGTNAKFDASGSSEMNVSGNTTFAMVEVTGASSFKGDGYRILRADLTASSASSVTAEVVEELTAKAMGAATIRYEGSPRTISLDSTSGSSIKKK